MVEKLLEAPLNMLTVTISAQEHIFVLSARSPEIVDGEMMIFTKSITISGPEWISLIENELLAILDPQDPL